MSATILAGLALAGAVAAGPTLSRESGSSDACADVYKASLAQAKVPYAAAGTMSGVSAATDSTWAVSVGGRLYLKLKGAWTSIPRSTEDAVKDVEEKEKPGAMACQQASDGAIDGQPTAIYDVHMTIDGTTSDTRYWISKRSGLPIQVESHVQGGIETRQSFRYTNVEAPTK